MLADVLSYIVPHLEEESHKPPLQKVGQLLVRVCFSVVHMYHGDPLEIETGVGAPSERCRQIERSKNILVVDLAMLIHTKEHTKYCDIQKLKYHFDGW